MPDASATPSQTTWNPSTNEGILFPVGLFKLTMLSVTTLGVYQGYWMYRNWKYLKQRRKVKAHAVRRADYPFFFMYPMLREIRELGVSMGATPTIAPGVLFLLWLGLTLLVNLPDPYYFLGNLDIIPILVVESYILKMNRDHGCERFIDSQLTVRNWLAILAGIVANVALLIVSLKLG